MIRRPRAGVRWPFFLACLFLVLPLLRAGAAEPWRLVPGELPLLIVAVHDGTDDLSGVEARHRDTSEDPLFNPRRDMHTEPLARGLAQLLSQTENPGADPPRRLRPTLLTNPIHRRFVDLNRTPERGADEAASARYHQAFHNALQAELDRLLELYPRVLLLDIHGQASYPFDLMLGTSNGASVSCWSRSRLWGEGGVIESMVEEGYRVQPSAPGEDELFSGGYITQRYGADPRVEVWQLEHGRDLRFDSRLGERYLQTLAELLEPMVRRLQNTP